MATAEALRQKARGSSRGESSKEGQRQVGVFLVGCFAPWLFAVALAGIRRGLWAGAGIVVTAAALCALFKLARQRTKPRQRPTRLVLGSTELAPLDAHERRLLARTPPHVVAGSEGWPSAQRDAVAVGEMTAATLRPAEVAVVTWWWRLEHERRKLRTLGWCALAGLDVGLVWTSWGLSGPQAALHVLNAANVAYFVLFFGSLSTDSSPQLDGLLIDLGVSPATLIRTVTKLRACAPPVPALSVSLDVGAKGRLPAAFGRTFPHLSRKLAERSSPSGLDQRRAELLQKAREDIESPSTETGKRIAAIAEQAGMSSAEVAQIVEEAVRECEGVLQSRLGKAECAVRDPAAL